jgi:hypothetical protein
MFYPVIMLTFSFSLFEPTKKRKRGIHTGQKGNSHSSQRVHAQFGREGEKVAYHSKKGVGRVQRTLQDSDRQANSAWVRDLCLLQRWHSPFD